MADIAYQVRGRNSHEPNNLTFGHYGKPRYDDSGEEWKFLRTSAGEVKVDDGGEPQTMGLIPLRSHYVPLLGSVVTPNETNETLRAIETWTQHSPEKQHAIRFALNSMPNDHAFTLSGSGPQKSREATENTDLIAFGYAAAPYEHGTHGLLKPIMICAEPGFHMLKVRFLKGTEHEDTHCFLPDFGNHAVSVPAPCKEAVLAIYFSADKRFLAIQQMSGTSIVIPTHGVREHAREYSPGNSLRLEHIVTLRRTDTGNYPHANISFQPRGHSLLGVVDTHGNWSAWQLHGRKSASSRILYKLKILTSGKLTPSNGNLRHFAKDVHFDGWHKICYLERSPDDKALLVCSRQIARTFNPDGSARGDVDMRLGSPATKNWILDAQTSTYHQDICYVLTSSRLQIMQLSAAEKRTDGLQLLCSWAHFHGRMGLSLSLKVVETARVTCLCISSTGGLDIWTYWVVWSDQGTVAQAFDPLLLGLPVDCLQTIERPLATAFEVIRIDSNAASKVRPASEILVQLVGIYSDGSLYSAPYSMECPSSRNVMTIEAGSALAIPQATERRIKSSLVVNEEDDLLDFVVPDDVVPYLGGKRHTPGDSPGTKKALLKTHDWSDIIHSESISSREETARDAIRDVENVRRSSRRDESNLQTLAELLPEVRIPDLAEVTGALSGLQYPVGANSDRDEAILHIFTSVLSSGENLQTRYDSTVARYVAHLSTEIPERVRVQTERLCRNAAFDGHASLLRTQRQREQEDADQMPLMELLQVRSSPPSSPPTTSSLPSVQSEPALAVLKRYTSISKASSAGLSSTATRNIMAHLPSNDLVDPSSYSYRAIEDRLDRDRTQQEIDDLDERARRKAERAAAREEKRKLQQAKMRNAVTQQSTVVPDLVLGSPQRDPRAVQSSQVVPLPIGSSQPGLTMTQPERGTHGERRRGVKKEPKHRVKGF